MDNVSCKSKFDKLRNLAFILMATTMVESLVQRPSNQEQCLYTGVCVVLTKGKNILYATRNMLTYKWNRPLFSFLLPLTFNFSRAFSHPSFIMS